MSDGIEVVVACQVCRGSGLVQGPSIIPCRCAFCAGTGRIKATTLEVPAEVVRLRRLLAMIYRKWENGITCQELDADGVTACGGSLGNAFTLTVQEQYQIMQALGDEAS